MQIMWYFCFSAPIFLTSALILLLFRSNIWSQMKAIGAAAGICTDKVFPHNLRHLFARVFWEKWKDLFYLADILGHSNVNTTRIYTMTTVKNHGRRMQVLGLVT